MTNTYPDDWPVEMKILEELRCIRAAMERLLRVLDEGKYVDYEMEKFGKKAPDMKPGEFAALKFLEVLAKDWDNDEDEQWEEAETMYDASEGLVVLSDGTSPPIEVGHDIGPPAKKKARKRSKADEAERHRMETGHA